MERKYDRVSRRRILGGIGATVAFGATGCIGGDESGESGDGGGSWGGSSLSDHPISQGIEDRPTLGGDPFETDVTLVVLDDPSCPRCAAFHGNTLPDIRTNLLEDGTGSYVARPYPVVYEWGGPAAHSLEAVYDRDEGAFWDLQNYYFTEQRRFDSSNVLDLTEGWVNENTELDGGAVVDDVRNEEYSDAIEATLDAASEAGAGRTTPVVFMFRNGEHQTTSTGSVSYTAIESALNL